MLSFQFWDSGRAKLGQSWAGGDPRLKSYSSVCEMAWECGEWGWNEGEQPLDDVMFVDGIKVAWLDCLQDTSSKLITVCLSKYQSLLPYVCFIMYNQGLIA